MARLSNQIVCTCALLFNFQSALVPPPEDIDSEVEEYFQSIDYSECEEGDGTGLSED